MKMKIRRTLGNELYHGKQFPINTIVLRSENGVEIFCYDFRQRGNLHIRHTN